MDLQLKCRDPRGILAMSDGFDRYVAWLDFSEHDRAPGYYGLLKLPTFETDLDRIQQAIFQESLNVSNFLRGPQRALAEAVLEELNRAESCLTSQASKAAYDAQLRASLGGPDDSPGEPGSLALPEPEAEPVRLVEVIVKAPTPAVVRPAVVEPAPRPPSASVPLPDLHEEAPVAAAHAPRPKAPAARSPADNSAASVADRSVLDAIEQVRRRTHGEPKKKAGLPIPPPSPSPAAASPEVVHTEPAPQQVTQTLSFSTALAQELRARIPAPVVKHRRGIVVGAVLLLGLGYAAQLTSSALDKPRPPRVRVQLDPKEEALLSEQFTVLYDLKQDTAARSAAAEKLRTASPPAIRKFSYRLEDLASRQPEEEIQQALRSLVESAKSGT